MQVGKFSNACKKISISNHVIQITTFYSLQPKFGAVTASIKFWVLPEPIRDYQDRLNETFLIVYAVIEPEIACKQIFGIKAVFGLNIFTSTWISSQSVYKATRNEPF